MKKAFARNILFLILVNLLIKPIWIFGIDMQVQKSLGHEVYGQYQVFLSFCIIFQIILDMGLQNYANKSIAKSPNSFYTLFPNIIIAKLGLGLLYFVIISLGALVLGYTGYQLGLLMTVGLIQMVQSYYLFFRSTLAANQLFTLDSILSVLDRLMLVLICGCLLYLPYFSFGFQLSYFVWAQVLTSIFCCLIAVYIIQRKYKIYWHTFKLIKVVGVIKQSLPFALLVFLMAVFMRLDQVLLEQICGSEAVGQYAGLFRLLDAANNMSGVLIGGMLLSFFGKHYKDENVVRNICKLCNFTLIPMAFLAPIIGYYYGADIMDVLQLKLGISINIHLGILLCAFPAYCLMYIYSTLLTAQGKLRTLTYIAIIAVLVNFVGNIILQHSYGVLGACIMHTVTIWLVVLAQIFYANKEYTLPVLGIKTMFYYAVIIIALFSIGKILQTAEMLWWMKSAIVFLTGGIIVLLLNGSEIKNVLLKLRVKN